MADASQIEEHMEVIGADGVHVGTVDKVEGDRIKLTKHDQPQTEDGQGGDKHRYIPMGLVAEIEAGAVRLSATGANAVTFEEQG
jgi:hypothetical protein